MPHSTKYHTKKRLGQHFLHDPFVIDQIVRLVTKQTDANANLDVVEIGPGLGALTGPLLQSLGKLQVVELDADVIPQLTLRCGPLGDLQIHQANALKFDFTSLVQPGQQLRLIGNLPYNISTPLLFHLFEQLPSIQDMHFMLQKEVVDRLVANPGSKRYGRLSVMAALHCQADLMFEIGPGAFKPPPKVDSAIVRLLPHKKPPVELADPDAFAQVVNQAFCHRRKTLRKIFKKQISTEQWSRLDIDPQARPETLGMQEYGQLTQAVGEGEAENR